jgi:hypothetical protein
MTGPMTSLDQWDDAARARYKEGRPKEQFRDYGDGVAPVVREAVRAQTGFIPLTSRPAHRQTP